MPLSSCSSCGRATRVLVVPYCDACLVDVKKAHKLMQQQPVHDGPPLLPPRHVQFRAAA